MNILYIGGGFVGTCSAAVSADSGHQTLVYDIDKEKIKKLNSGDRDIIQSCIFEEGLGDLLIRNQERIKFTTDYEEVVSFLDACDAVFMCLPTPEIGETGESDVHFYMEAAHELAQALAKRNNQKQDKYIVIVNKSTVPINMITGTQSIMNEHGVKNIGIVSNPEFLIEGKAIQGSIRPDRVVVGAVNKKDFDIMRQIYQRFYASAGIAYLEVNPKEAAAGKLLANFYLFNRLAICFDVIGRTAEAFAGIGFENLRKILTTDPRIGSWGMYNSLYAGGSCLVKDARSLSHQLQMAGQNANLVQESYLANKRQLEYFLSRAETDAQVDWSGKQIALLGLAFKQDTNDVRNSPSIDIVRFLQEKNVGAIHCYDPAAKDMFKALYPESEIILYCASEQEAIASADIIIIATDWPQFRGIADAILALKKQPLIMDGRRILQHRYEDLNKKGCAIIAVGSPFLKQS